MMECWPRNFDKYLYWPLIFTLHVCVFLLGSNQLINSQNIIDIARCNKNLILYSAAVKAEFLYSADKNTAVD